MPISDVLPLASSSIGLNPQPVLMAIWSGAKDRVVEIITSKPGVAGSALAVGFICGMSIVWGLDNLFQKKLKQLTTDRHNSDYCHQMFRGERLSKIDQPSPGEKSLETRLKTIFGITLSTLLFSVGMALATWKTYGFEHSWFDSSSLAIGGIGFALGAQFFEYCNKNSEHKKREFIQHLETDGNVVLGWRLDLSYYCSYLRYLNLLQRGKEFYQTFKLHDRPCYVLVFRGCRLTNADLKSLKEGEWFSLFPHINISDNPHLTAAGLKWVGEGGINKLESLDLSRVDLTDNDLIEMAESGHFNNLKELIIRDNPRLTGKGLAYIGEIGFENLNMLDIGGNSQVLGQGLDEWIGKGGFKKLTALALSHSQITENDLSRMVDEAEWFRNLKGLGLDYSTNLQKFPPNISRMTKLARARDPSGGLSGGSPVLFEGEGIFFRNYGPQFTVTEEFKELMKPPYRVLMNLKWKYAGNYES